MALIVIRVRIKASERPTSLRKILIPPLGMATGYSMFFIPEMRIPMDFAIGAIAAGLVLSYPLIATSHFEVKDDEIYLKRSKSFIFILLGLLAVRLALHNVVEQYITLPQTGAVFFVLAFFMLLPWRIAMMQRFLKVQRDHLSKDRA